MIAVWILRWRESKRADVIGIHSGEQDYYESAIDATFFNRNIH